MNSYHEQNNSIGEVVAIYASSINQVTTKSLDKGVFKENYGLIGDKHISSGDRQVTIFTFEGRNSLASLKVEGLCVKKFYENITIKDLDTSKLTIGQEFTVGSAEFQITGLGKRCFSECNIVKKGETCALKYGVVFAKVIAGGEVTVGDKLRLQH